MKRLVVVLDDERRFARFHYFLALLIDCWRAQGWQVTFCSDWQRLPEADLALLHVNRTVLPAELAAACRQRYPQVINGATGDISKRRVSSQLVRPGDGYTGPVIVKTDANCGGRRERYGDGMAGTARKLVDRLLPWRQAARLASGRYPIYPAASAVPAAVWQDPGLVVERLCCERDGDLYALRQWVFFGDRELGRIAWAREPIVKADNVVRSALLDEVPEPLRARRAELGFDYGKFDYVMHQGQPVLLDANRTPTYGRHLGPAGREYAARLAQGIACYPC